MPQRKDSSTTLENVVRSFPEKNFSPLYLFHGEEDFLVDEALDALIENALDVTSRSFNLDIVYGSDVEVKDVLSLASSFPMMSEHRVVIVRDVEKLTIGESAKELLLRYLDNPMSTTILVFVAAKMDMRLTISKAFGDHGVVAEFKPLYENQVPDWIVQRVRKFGKKMGPEAAQLLQAHVGTSLRALQNEIDKLLIYVSEKGAIEIDDVEEIVGMSKTFNIFELQRAIAQAHAARAMEILEHMLNAGDSPLGIIVMLTRFFQKLWIVPALRRQTKSEYELASALQVSPFFVREYMGAAQQFTLERIERALHALCEADQTLKSTQEDPKLVMTTLLYGVVKPLQEVFVR